MVTGIGQYNDDHVYVYANDWSVRNDNHLDDHRQSEHHADVYCGAANLFRSDIVCIANYFEQWYHWFVVTGIG